MLELKRSITSDASKIGWGAWNSSSSVHGKWSSSERELHINILELKSVDLSFLSLFQTTYSCSILIRLDNSTAVSYINKQGGTCCKILCGLALKIWEFCVNHNALTVFEFTDEIGKKFSWDWKIL